MLQVPQVEHLAPVDQLLRAHHLEYLLAQYKRGDYRLFLVQQGAGLENLKAGRRHQLVENLVVQRGAAADVVGLEPDQVVLEEAEEEVLQKCAEMGHQLLAGLDQLANSWRRESELAPGSPVVSVAFEPRGVRRNLRYVQRARFYSLSGHSKYRSARLISDRIKRIGPAKTVDYYHDDG